jgi:hypothetical protein
MYYCTILYYTLLTRMHLMAARWRRLLQLGIKFWFFKTLLCARFLYQAAIDDSLPIPHVKRSKRLPHRLRFSLNPISCLLLLESIKVRTAGALYSLMINFENYIFWSVSLTNLTKESQSFYPRLYVCTTRVYVLLCSCSWVKNYFEYSGWPEF